MLPLWAADALAAHLPNARLAVIPDPGHMPFWEAPEPFFAIVETFLTATMP